MQQVSWVVAGVLAMGLGSAASAQAGQAAQDSPWALVPEDSQRISCDNIADALSAGGGGPLARLDDDPEGQDAQGAWQCVWDSPTGVYFYAEFDVDLVAPERQLAAGLRDFRDEVEADCARVRWTHAVEPATGFRLAARGRAQCLGGDEPLDSQHVMMWLVEDEFGQRLLNLQHSRYPGDEPAEAAIGTLIRFMEGR